MRIGVNLKPTEEMDRRFRAAVESGVPGTEIRARFQITNNTYFRWKRRLGLAITTTSPRKDDSRTHVDKSYVERKRPGSAASQAAKRQRGTGQIIGSTLATPSVVQLKPLPEFRRAARAMKEAGVTRLRNDREQDPDAMIRAPRVAAAGYVPKGRTCQWPMWADKERPGRNPLFCGQPVARRSYCACHAALAYVPVRAPEARNEPASDCRPGARSASSAAHPSIAPGQAKDGGERGQEVGQSRHGLGHV